LASRLTISKPIADLSQTSGRQRFLYDRSAMSGEWLRGPRRIRVVFFGVMLLLAATLGWLGWRLLAQDQQLAAQRLTERRDAAAALVVAAFEKRLLEIEQELDRLQAGLAPVRLLCRRSMPRCTSPSGTVSFASGRTTV
jgi:hypothetical protein